MSENERKKTNEKYRKKNCKHNNYKKKKNEFSKTAARTDSDL